MNVNTAQRKIKGQDDIRFKELCVMLQWLSKQEQSITLYIDSLLPACGSEYVNLGKM